MGADGTCSTASASVTEATGVELTGTTETQVLGDVGTFSACDVWMRVTPDWLSRVTLRVYARVGLARVLMRSVPLSTVTVTDDGDHRAGIPVSLRGHPCRAYQVTVQASEGDPLEDGAFYLQSWHAGGAVAASAGDGSAPRAEVDTVLQGRTTMGASVDLHADDDGRLLIANPLLGDNYITLPEVTSPPGAPSGEAQIFYTDDLLRTVAENGTLLTEFLGTSGVALRAAGSPMTVQPSTVSSGVGKNLTVAGGKAAAGSKGGSIVIGADNGGTAGTDVSGDIILQLGPPLAATGETGRIRIRRGTTEISEAWCNMAAANHLNEHILSAYTIHCEGIMNLFAAHNPANFQSAFHQCLVGSGGGWPIHLKPLSSYINLASDHSLTTRIAITPHSSAPTIEGGATCTSFKLGHQKRTGTGANAGAPLTIKGQDGQNVASGTNNTGGELRLESGGKGAGGSGGADGSVFIKTGSSDRIEVEGSGASIALTTSRVWSRAPSGLIEELASDIVSSALAEIERTLPKRYTETNTSSSNPVILYTDDPVPEESTVLYRFTVLAHASDGDQANKGCFLTRQAVVTRVTGAPTLDVHYSSDVEQRMFADAGDAAYFDISSTLHIDTTSTGVELVLALKDFDSTWHWVAWGERILITP